MNSIRPMISMILMISRKTPCWNIRQVWTSYWMMSLSLPLHRFCRTLRLPHNIVHLEKSLNYVKMNSTVDASRDSPFTKTFLYASSAKTYRQVHEAKTRSGPTSRAGRSYATDIIPLILREIHHHHRITV